MIKIIIAFYLSLFSLYCISQNSEKNDSTRYASNSIFFEIGGNGGLYSFNYDRVISVKKNIINLQKTE
jgi:hypothetical protein